MKTRFIIPFLLVLFIMGCNRSPVQQKAALPSHSGPVRIAGAYALSPIMKVWIQEYRKINPGVEFEITETGSGNGLSRVMQGKIDLAMVSSDIPMGADTSYWIFPVARLGVVPIINPKNPYLKEIMKKGIKHDDLADLFSAEKPKTWGDLYGKPGKDPVHPYLRSDSSGATVVLAKYLWLDLPELKGKGMEGEIKMLDAVKSDPLALGYCNFIYAFDPKTNNFNPDVQVLPLDFNSNGKIDGKENIFGSGDRLQRAMWLGKFPCVLVRNLYLVTKGKPETREVVDFLNWILTKGQDHVAQNGYIELHTSEIKYLVNVLETR